MRAFRRDVIVNLPATIALFRGSSSNLSQSKMFVIEVLVFFMCTEKYIKNILELGQNASVTIQCVCMYVYVSQRIGSIQFVLRYSIGHKGTVILTLQ